MKASFFGFFALAASAIAAPLTQDAVERDIDAVVPHIEAREVTEFLNDKRTIKASADLYAKINSCHSAVAAVTVKIDTNVGKVGSGKGKISKEACAKASAPHIHSVIKVLTSLKADIKAAGKINVTGKAEINLLVGIIVKLVKVVLTCIHKLALSIGLRAELKAALTLCFSLLGDILSLTCGLVPGVINGCVGALGSIVLTVQASALRPCLGAVFGVSGGISAGLSARLGFHISAAAGVAI